MATRTHAGSSYSVAGVPGGTCSRCDKATEQVSSSGSVFTPLAWRIACRVVRVTKVGNESVTPFCSSMNCGFVGVRGCFMLLLLSRNGEMTATVSLWRYQPSLILGWILVNEIRNLIGTRAQVIAFEHRVVVSMRRLATFINRCR